MNDYSTENIAFRLLSIFAESRRSHSICFIFIIFAYDVVIDVSQ